MTSDALSLNQHGLMAMTDDEMMTVDGGFFFGLGQMISNALTQAFGRQTGPGPSPMPIKKIPMTENFISTYLTTAGKKDYPVM